MKTDSGIAVPAKSFAPSAHSVTPRARLTDQTNALQLWWQNAKLHRVKRNEEPPAHPMFVKDAWAAPQQQEAEIHHKMTGEFGAGELWAHQELDSNEFFYKNGHLRDWHIFIHDDEEPSPFFHAILVHLVMYFKTVGTPLRYATTPYELLTAVLHAMLAHRTMLKKYGYLHRDISVNNIMMTSPRRDLDPPTKFDVRDIDEKILTTLISEGLLIDADLARKIVAPSVNGKTVSGTWEFISRRLHRFSDEGLSIQHAASDDLESSIWVILWEAYRHGARLRDDLSCFSEFQRDIYKHWCGSGHPVNMIAAKTRFDETQVNGKAFPQCPPLNVFICTMLREFEVSKFQDLSTVEWTDYHYGLYFQKLWSCLKSADPTLHMAWPDIFSSGFAPDLPTAQYEPPSIPGMYQ
ncbi:hypothetical protein DL93DRAFT_2089750 [Clavulina sp. PMI_390]|nr:hypothetical protein DL93DRAFT_2089750 [Clavulina sp. PMI_390]